MSTEDLASKSRKTVRFKAAHVCNCGYHGNIADHLRVHQQCRESMRQELSLDADMSDEVLIVKVTLALHGCPAFRCPGGDHEDIPEMCIAWWKNVGWEVMEWQGAEEDLNSELVNQRCRKFVSELTGEERDKSLQESQFSPAWASTPRQRQPNNVEANMSITPSASSFQSNHPTPSQSSVRFQEAHRCICGHEGPIAAHLRASKPCLEQLRRDSEMQVSGSDEVFITKSTVFWEGCPAEDCPGGSHRRLPSNCIDWWKERGWGLMGWKGSSDNADSKTLKAKVSMYLRNLRRREKENNQGGREEVDQGQGRSGNREESMLPHLQCQFCSYTGPLSSHLHRTPACLKAYMYTYHLQRTGHCRKAIFDLGLLIAFCPNPECSTETNIVNMAAHVQGACSKFYLKEVEAVFQWNDINMDNLVIKVKNRKSYVKKLAEEAATRGISLYRKKLQGMLVITCCACYRQGPLLQEKDHEMQFANLRQGGIGWLCRVCLESNGEADVESEMDTLQRLGKPTGEEADDTLKPIKVKVNGGLAQRVVFAPATMALESEFPIEQDVINLQSPTSTVLVPRHPGAIDTIGEGAFLRAMAEKDALKKGARTCTRGPFTAMPTIPLSVLYRKKLVDIHEERQSWLNRMTGKGNGEITSRDPPRASIKERHPHFASTKNICLANTCKWSEAYEERRQEESMACSHISGQVKTKVRIEVLHKVAHHNPELQAVISAIGFQFSPSGVAPILPLAPVVLQHLRGKVKLLLEHIISPMYTNWDLEIKFKREEWTAELVGYLYSAEYEELNMQIAREQVQPQETRRSVLLHPATLPTVSLRARWLSDRYSLSQEEAEVSISS